MQTEFARGQMITQQVRAWDVLDERVLDAMAPSTTGASR